MNMNTAQITGDQHFIKSINRNLLLRLLFAEPAQSRAALTTRTGLTKSTVSRLVNELLDEGWVTEDSVPVTGMLGRRPTPLRIDGRGLVLVGAELGIDNVRVVSTTVLGEVLHAEVEPLHNHEPRVACRQLVELVAKEASRVATEGGQLLGIGVGLPGAVDAAKGVIDVAPNLGWHRVEVKEPLLRQLRIAGMGDVPIHCQNEADLAAIGESVFGDRLKDDPLVYVSCGVGVGAGVVLNGTLFTGSSGAAGEIGHTILHVEGVLCSCGRRGCAEAYIGLKAVAAAVGMLQAGDVDRDGLRTDLPKQRSQPARQAFSRAGEALGVLLQNVWTTFNPKAIVLGGEAVSLGDRYFVEAAIKRLEAFGEEAGASPPPVRVSKYGDLATAVGGAAFALHTMLQPYGAP